YMNRHPGILAGSGYESPATAIAAPMPVRNASPESASSAARNDTQSAAGKSPAPEMTGASAGDRDSFVLSVRAKQDTWITITADGQEVMHGVLSAAGARSVRAKSQVV